MVRAAQILLQVAATLQHVCEVTCLAGTAYDMAYETALYTLTYPRPMQGHQ